MSEKNRYIQVMEMLYGFDWQTQLTPYYVEPPQSGIAKQYDYFTRDRHAQLQKARREIAEGNKHCEEVMKCKCCGKAFAHITENFSGFCWVCRVWG